MAGAGLPRKLWAVDLAVMVLVLFAMAQQSVQLSLRHPLYGIVNRINENAVSYLGIVVTSSASEDALLNSGFFVPSTHVPYIDFVGRRFNIGKIKDADVVIVNVGGEIPNVVLGTQVLFDLISIHGIIHLGSAGSISDSLYLGDVAVPASVAFTGNWEWKSNESKRGKLKFGDFNLPQKGANSLGSADFQKVKLYTAGSASQNLLWLPVDSNWLTIASELQGLKLQECVNEINETNCLENTPEIVFGVKGSTADVYLKNAAYAQFLSQRLNATFVDTSSAAVALASLTNGVPYIVFRAISNLVIEGKSDSNSRYLANANSVKVAVKFIELVSKPGPAGKRSGRSVVDKKERHWHGKLGMWELTDERRPTS
ncbi:unnamed protein product [Dovyalis caffra]|uniref:Nucleoside phosphorylase domain-containing protein n=1 Tax=Dovyalis caffra TaxID=77055 RepID=A0AAV1SS14_9ROSI|nr:unnamed protein product [Dovyalis caffra]